ncbi:cob(I)yrinic acid a,c-diamide adenosyltransferase [Stetteria hydrogenophila]
MPLYTRTGDSGETFCSVAGGRVPKDHPVIEFLGSLDEAVSLLGLARSLTPPWLAEASSDLALIQDILFNVGVHLARGGVLGERHVEWLEAVTDKYYGRAPLRHFILPAGPAPAAAVHAARAAVRRAERRLVSAKRAGYSVDDVVLKVVNRASDALFALAVYLSRALGYQDEPAGSHLKRLQEGAGEGKG